jgi:hypothetical protein
MHLKADGKPGLRRDIQRSPRNQKPRRPGILKHDRVREITEIEHLGLHNNHRSKAICAILNFGGKIEKML